MRHMTPELEEKPIEREIDDRLEMKSLSRKDRRKYKKEKLRETMADMSKSEKAKYLLYYYKEAIIISAVLLIFGIWLGRTIYGNTRPLTISYVVINCGNQLEFNLDTMEQYAKDIGKYKGCRIKGDTNVTISGEEYAKGYEGNGNSQIYINYSNPQEYGGKRYRDGYRRLRSAVHQRSEPRLRQSIHRIPWRRARKPRPRPRPPELSLPINHVNPTSALSICLPLLAYAGAHVLRSTQAIF